MKKQKTKRTKWSYERAKQLEQERVTTPLTWTALGEKYGMTAAAMKSSLQKWLKRVPAPAALQAEDLGTITFPKDAQPEFFQYANDRLAKARREVNAWAELIAAVK